MLCGIYAITNKINGKMYIGLSRDIHKRWKQHLSLVSKKSWHGYDYAIYRAIRKYGIDNFSFDIIETCNEDDLNSKEMYWIDFYDTYKNGYNSTRGGEGAVKIDRKLVQQLWHDGFSPKEIREKLGISQGAVIASLKDDPTYTAFEAQRRSQNKHIDQYDLNGNYIKTFASIDDAAKDVGCNRSCISRIAMSINGKQSVHGFMFRYHGDPPPTKYKNNTLRAVNQYALSGRYIATFPSIIAAARALNMSKSGVSACVNGTVKSNSGFMFRFAENNDTSDIEPYKKKKTGGGYNTNGKAVQQYTLDGVLIATFPSLSEVKRQLGMLPDEISMVCRGIKKTYRGFIWKFQGDDVA